MSRLRVSRNRYGVPYITAGEEIAFKAKKIATFFPGKALRDLALS